MIELKLSNYDDTKIDIIYLFEDSDDESVLGSFDLSTKEVKLSESVDLSELREINRLITEYCVDCSKKDEKYIPTFANSLEDDIYKESFETSEDDFEFE